MNSEELEIRMFFLEREIFELDKQERLQRLEN